jgi:hypothetical protein
MGMRFFNKLFRSAEWFLEFWVLFGFLKLGLGFKNALFIGTKNGTTFRFPSRQNIRYIGKRCPRTSRVPHGTPGTPGILGKANIQP